MVRIMYAIRSVGALALALLVAACGDKQSPAPENQQTMSGSLAEQHANSVYAGSGTVRSITGDRVAIAHGPIAGIGWPAMTMTFTAPPNMASGVKVGDKVEFSFRQNSSAYVLTSVKRS